MAGVDEKSKFPSMVHDNIYNYIEMTLIFAIPFHNTSTIDYLLQYDQN